jgi:hypothetical protein
MLQATAGKILTLKAKPEVLVLKGFTRLDFALPASNWFSGIIPPATRTFILWPKVCHADATVHSARCDQSELIERFHGVSCRRCMLLRPLNYDTGGAPRFHPFILSFAVLTHITSLDHMLAIFLLQFIQDLLQPAFSLRAHIPQA